MNINPIRTRAVHAGELTLEQLLDESIDSLTDGSIVIITSKIVSLCENAVVPMEGTDRDMLIEKESELYLPGTASSYNIYFSTKYGNLIPNAGIDESNANGNYVLWPRDPWHSANQARAHLRNRFGLQNIGVIITDSTCQILRRGTVGISMAHSGFAPVEDYINQPDIFGRPFHYSQASIANGLAAAAVVVMGEGAQQTPLAIASELDFVHFSDNDPTPEEIADLTVSIDEDIFAPFLKAVDWQKGDSDTR